MTETAAGQNVITIGSCAMSTVGGLAMSIAMFYQDRDSLLAATGGAVDSPFADEAGVPVRACHSHADVKAWFGGEGTF